MARLVNTYIRTKLEFYLYHFEACVAWHALVNNLLRRTHQSVYSCKTRKMSAGIKMNYVFMRKTWEITLFDKSTVCIMYLYVRHGIGTLSLLRTFWEENSQADSLTKPTNVVF